MTDRVEPGYSAGEKEMLVGWLDYYRATIVSKLDALAETTARRQLVGSGTNLLGMVRHLAFAEDYWFSQIFAGEPERLVRTNPGDDVPSEQTVADVIALYAEHCERSRQIVAGADLDEHARGDLTNRRGHVSQFNLRWIVTHMIEETARHAGHADIIREQIDGATGS